MPFVYMLRCSDGSYYVGSTRSPEKQIQGWGRKKREALIRGDFELLPGLSSRRGGRPPSGG